jgi:uncharacterized protein (TIGR02996 family)
MDLEQAILAAIRDDPREEASWAALADWLEERGDPRGELLRLTRSLMRPGGPNRPAREERLRELLASGLRPCWPTLTNSVGLELALIPPGAFLMGSPADEAERDRDERQHEVEITRPLWLGVYPVTQAEYERVMGTNPSCFSPTGVGKQKVRRQDATRFPVENVSWKEAMDFCQRLSERGEEKRQGRVYRLPTEAEWEYSCRGGASSSTPFAFGATLSSTRANFDGYHPYGGAKKGPNRERTTAVGSYPANAWGLYDMHGNVWEWCADWHRADYYTQSPRQDPAGPSKGSNRVMRGGGWCMDGQFCRSAFRHRDRPTYRSYSLGFRVALVLSGS